MRICKSFAATAAFLAWTVPAQAQLYENVGTRAQGLGGAFVAVADDATASWWNPAGLASGAYFNAVIERGQLTQPAEPDGAGLAERVRTTGFSAAFPSLGVSYYRFRISGIAPVTSTAPSTDARQDPGATGVLVRSLSVSALGVTVGQSLGSHLVVASTLKLMRGGVRSAVRTDASDPLDAADALDMERNTRTDADLGAMASFGRFRLGVSLRNLSRPTFGADGEEVALERQARAGAALFSRPFGPIQMLTIAGDADLTSTSTPFGAVRHVAGGAEAWTFARRLGVRAGVSGNTIGETRSAASVGISLAPLAGVYVDAARTFGADRSLEGWTSSLRVTF